MGKIYANVLEAVGNTPIIRLNRITKGIAAPFALKSKLPIRDTASKTGSRALLWRMQKGKGSLSPAARLSSRRPATWVSRFRLSPP